VKTEAGIELGKVTKWLIYENKQKMGFEKHVMSIIEETHPTKENTETTYNTYTY